MKVSQRSSLASVAAVVLAASVFVCCAGCEINGKEFRTVAGPSLEAGVASLASGIINGAFAVYRPDDVDGNSTGETSSDDTTTGGT